MHLHNLEILLFQLLAGIGERGKNWLKELQFRVYQLNGVYFKLTVTVQSWMALSI